MEETTVQKLTFIYEHDGYQTLVEKVFDYRDTLTQFEALVTEIENCLLACGFSKELISKYMNSEGLDMLSYVDDQNHSLDARRYMTGCAGTKHTHSG